MAAISAFGTEEADREAALVGGLIRAVREDGELRRLMHENVLDDQWKQALPIVERGKRRGELPEAADPRVLMEVASALVYQRLLIHAAPVDKVLLPLLRSVS